jgi:hypothetical protein
MRALRGLAPNRGDGAPRRRRPPQRRATYRLSGTLRWVDVSGQTAVLMVQDANSAGRRLKGRTVTLDLRDARLDTLDRDRDGRRTGLDLLPGEAVTVTARLPRDLPAPPAEVPVRRLATEGQLR